MKTKLITLLKSSVILVDGRIFDYEVFKNGIHLSDEEGKTDFIDGNWSLLGKLKDLTDEQIKNADIVETKPYGSPPYFCTIYYPLKGKNKDGFNPGLCVDNGNQFKESFLSALESEGVLFENPNKKSHFNPEEFIQEEYEEFMKAEQNVFSPETLIFVEQ